MSAAILWAYHKRYGKTKEHNFVWHAICYPQRVLFSQFDLRLSRKLPLEQSLKLNGAAVTYSYLEKPPFSNGPSKCQRARQFLKKFKFKASFHLSYNILCFSKNCDNSIKSVQQWLPVMKLVLKKRICLTFITTVIYVMIRTICFNQSDFKAFDETLWLDGPPNLTPPPNPILVSLSCFIVLVIKPSNMLYKCTVT